MKMLSKSFENMEVVVKMSANEAQQLIAIIRQFISENSENDYYQSKELLKKLEDELEF